jgi:hypothetical protein
VNKAEVVEIVKYISNCYGNKFKTDDPKGLIDSWYAVLIDYEFDIIRENLYEYVKTNKFAPSVADLIAIPDQKDRAIPDKEQTQNMISSWDEQKEQADPEQIENELAKMRKILKRG